jgi:hypothetical protein
MRDFRRKDKKKEGIFLEVPSFLVIARLTGSDKSISCYMRKPPPCPPFSQAKSPSDDGLFACEIVYTRRKRRGYINGAVQRNVISNP